MTGRSRARSLRHAVAALTVVAAVAAVATLALAAGATPAAAGQQTATGTATAAASVKTADAERLIAALGVHAGSSVAEIGAGGGTMTVTMAREVGTEGRVYTTELGDDHLSTLRKAVDAAGVPNVTVVEGDPAKTNLPDQCCDALFMQRVYHHFHDPAAMNVSLLRALKPGGRLAVMDFPPDAGRSAAPKDRAGSGHHGVTAATVKTELEAAGFEAVTTQTGDGRDFFVIARKPAAP
jgi:ubiquinone/menaquinone biosynthesis C-methylase UbiE